jgi:hypothetical protein
MKMNSPFLNDDNFFKSFELDENGMLKARQVKYIKRTGSPGNYKYFYEKGGSSKGEQSNNIKEGDVYSSKHGDNKFTVKQKTKDGNFIVESSSGNRLTTTPEKLSELTKELGNKPPMIDKLKEKGMTILTKDKNGKLIITNKEGTEYYHLIKKDYDKYKDIIHKEFGEIKDKQKNEGRKYPEELEGFAKKIKNAKSPEEAFDILRKIKGVSSEESREFSNKYLHSEKGRKTTPLEASGRFWADVTGNKYDFKEPKKEKTWEDLPAPKGYNKEVWNYSKKEAEKNKQWAKNKKEELKGKEWEASQASKNMLKEYLEKPIEQLTKEYYDYFKMRSHAYSKNSGYPIAPDWNKKWKEITGEFPKKD